jgi:hypothetical protein
LTEINAAPSSFADRPGMVVAEIRLRLESHRFRQRRHIGHVPGSEALLVHAEDGLTWAVDLNARDKRNPAMTLALHRLMWQNRETVPQWGR